MEQHPDPTGNARAANNAVEVSPAIDEHRKRAIERREYAKKAKARSDQLKLVQLEWERIYQPASYNDDETESEYNDWLSGYAERIAAFGKAATAAGLAEYFDALVSGDPDVQIGYDLLKAGASGDANKVLKQLLKLDRDDRRWYVVTFNETYPPPQVFTGKRSEIKIPNETPAPSSSDGPQEPNLFIWKNQRAVLQPIPWKLVCHLWACPKRTSRADAVIDEVWGHDSERSDGALKTAISRANNALAEVAIPIRICQKSGFVTLELTSV